MRDSRGFQIRPGNRIPGPEALSGSREPSVLSGVLCRARAEGCKRNVGVGGSLTLIPFDTI